MTGAAGRRGAKDGNVSDDATDPEDEVVLRGHGATRLPVGSIEVWSEHWFDELHTMYHSLCEQAQMLGAFLEHASFNDFVEFMYLTSSKLPPRYVE